MLSILLGFFLLAPLPANAVVPQEHRVSNPGVGGGGGREMDNIRERLRTNESRGAENQKNRCDRLQEQGKRILTRYQRRIEQMNKYLDRVRSRRNKLQTQGKDITKTDRAINAVRAHIAQVQTALNQEQPTLTTVNCASDLKVQAQAMRTSMQNIHQSFSQGKKFLQDVVHELRETTIRR